MIIRETNPGDLKLVNEMARLHLSTFPDYFLSMLGLPFMKAVYREYIEDPNAGIVIAEEDGNLVGLLSYMDGTSQVPVNVINSRPLLFLYSAARLILRKPSLYRNVKNYYESCKKAKSKVYSRKFIELGSFALYPHLRGNGTGTKMLDYIKAMPDYNTCDCVSLTTASDDNDRVNLFYLKRGFVPVGMVTMPEGKCMTIYQYSPNPTKYRSAGVIMQ